MALFTPVGDARDIAATTLVLTVEAILDDNTTLAGAILDQVQPESPDNSVATVASCTNVMRAMSSSRPAVTRPSRVTCPARSTAAPPITTSPTPGIPKPCACVSNTHPTTAVEPAAWNRAGTLRTPCSSGVTTIVNAINRPALEADVLVTP